MQDLTKQVEMVSRLPWVDLFTTTHFIFSLYFYVLILDFGFMEAFCEWL